MACFDRRVMPITSAQSADDWFAAYGVCHQNRTNKLIHWVCVPAIMFSILGLLWDAPVPRHLTTLLPGIRWTYVLIGLALLFYLRLSITLAVGMGIVSAVMVTVLVGWERLQLTPVWQLSLGLFVMAWIVQLIGHKIEGAKPAFFDDLKFLLIGPIWLLGFLYRKLGLPY